MATLTLPGADIPGYYHQLGIQLPERARHEASVHCFADPGAYRREDRNPSCSVNVINGAWQCHACGARGGAYDAALAKSYTPRTARVRAHPRQKLSPHARRCKSPSRTSLAGTPPSPAARPLASAAGATRRCGPLGSDSTEAG